tara:strand:- start:263 stop:1207 length:945 start_codon:yes stop_codon:yes gene_type:complete
MSLKDYLPGRKKRQQINELEADVARLKNANSELQKQASLLNQNKTANLGSLITKIKEINSILISVTQRFEAEQSGIDKNLNKLEDFTDTAKLLGESMRKLSILLELAGTDAADIVSLAQTLNNFESEWGNKNELSDEKRDLMVQEHNAIIQQYNLHNIHARKLERKLGKEFKSIQFNINGKSIGGDALHNESIHLNHVLTAIANEIQNLTTLNEKIIGSSSDIMSGAETIRNFSSSIIRNCQLLGEKVKTVTKTSQIIQNIDNKIITIDETIIQDLHNVHNSGYKRNEDQTSDMYATWEATTPTPSTKMTRRGA